MIQIILGTSARLYLQYYAYYTVSNICTSPIDAIIDFRPYNK